MIFASRITAAASDLAQVCTVVRSPEALSAALNTSITRIIIDLDAQPGAELDQLVKLIRKAAPTTQIIGFLPHVRADLADAARTAGFDRVLARSAFVQQLPDLLSP